MLKIWPAGINWNCYIVCKVVPTVSEKELSWKKTYFDDCEVVLAWWCLDLWTLKYDDPEVFSKMKNCEIRKILFLKSTSMFESLIDRFVCQKEMSIVFFKTKITYIDGLVVENKCDPDSYYPFFWNQYLGLRRLKCFSKPKPVNHGLLVEQKGDPGKRNSGWIVDRHHQKSVQEREK